MMKKKGKHWASCHIGSLRTLQVNISPCPIPNSLYTKNERKSQEAKGETGWSMHFQKSKKALALDACVCR